MSKLVIDGVGRTFPGVHGGAPTIALQPVSLSVADNDFITILGPSGCGKSTLLRIVAGLDTPTTGSVMLDGAPVMGPDGHVLAALSISGPVFRMSMERACGLVAELKAICGDRRGARRSREPSHGPSAYEALPLQRCRCRRPIGRCRRSRVSPG